MAEPHDFSPEFVKLMENRMATSYHKYGPWAKNRKIVDCLANVERRIKIYKDTGNKEGLVDAANFLMMEFMIPLHPNAHFRAESAEESPGLVCLKEDMTPVKKSKKKN